MRVADFTFELPDSLIARHPLAERRNSRLLTLDGESGVLAHRQFTDLLEHLRPGDLMVFNNTRVIPARLFASVYSSVRIRSAHPPGSLSVLWECVRSLRQDYARRKKRP